MSMLKVPPFVMAFMRLHNFCINSKCTATPTMLHLDEHRIRQMAATRGSTSATRRERGTQPVSDVRMDSRGIPVEILGSGHHFADLPRQRRPEFTSSEDVIPMETMRRQVALKGLRRPQVNKFAGKRMRNSV